MFGHLFGWLIERDREKDIERHEQLAALAFEFASHADNTATVEFREWALPIAKGWVVDNLSQEAVATFDDASIAVRHLDRETLGLAGAVDVSVGGRGTRRSWFIVQVAEDGTVAIADIVDFDPRLSPRP